MTDFSDFSFARAMPVRAVLFPAAAQRGFQIVDGIRAAHFSGKSSRRSPLSRNPRWVGSKRGTILAVENHPAVSRNEAIVTSALPKASTILASLGQAAFVWDIATDAMVWSEHLAAVFPDIPVESPVLLGAASS